MRSDRCSCRGASVESDDNDEEDGEACSGFTRAPGDRDLVRDCGDADDAGKAGNAVTLTAG